MPDFSLEPHLTSLKKTAVGAEKEIKFWVFYSRLKSIFIDEHIILKDCICGLLSHSMLFPATTISNITSITVDKASLSTAKMSIATTRNTNKDTRGIILKKLFRALVNLYQASNKNYH